MTTCRILVVDDNVGIHRDFAKIVAAVTVNALVPGRDVLAASLPPPRPPEYELCSVESGEAALAELKKACEAARPFAIAFVDMRMPGCDGIETVEKLLKLQPDLEIAFSSAYMDYSWSEVTERLRRPGLRFVPKPWTGSQILAVLHELRARVLGRRLSKFR
jgi:two-component system, NtrC family, sensor kinase